MFKYENISVLKIKRYLRSALEALVRDNSHPCLITKWGSFLSASKIHACRKLEVQKRNINQGLLG